MKSRCKHGGLVLVTTLLTTACHHAPLPQTPEPVVNASNAFSWLQGCWKTAEGVEETWVQSRQGDQLFGYSVVSKDGQRMFFEQLRLDVNGKSGVLHAYPNGVGPTPFKGTLTAPQTAEFVNARNDFPQRIRYSLNEATLIGYIADLDQTRSTQWQYQPCD